MLPEREERESVYVKSGRKGGGEREREREREREGERERERKIYAAVTSG